MRVTITKLRQDLFRLTERARRGEPVEFVHKGVVFKIVPENKASKLAQLGGHPVVSPHTSLEKASRDLLREMQSEWEKDWSEL